MLSGLFTKFTTGITLLTTGALIYSPAVTHSTALPITPLSHDHFSLTAGNSSDIDSSVPGIIYSGPTSPGGQEVGLVVGGTGTPIPSNAYLENASKFLDNILGPDVPIYGVYTPETGSPLYTGIKSLTFNKSIAEGVTIVVNRIKEELNDHHTVAVLGYSQSSIIMSEVMNELEQQHINPNSVKFVLLADPNNDNGGLLERFDGLSFPSIGISFNGPTNPDTPFDTTIYTQEYDGYADFPKYPIDLLADLNAFMGILYIHGYYLQLTNQQITPLGQTIAPDGQTLPDGERGQALDMGTYDHTTYYMIPMASDDVVPLLRPLEDIPLIGKPLAEFLNPTLEQLINLGYDNPDNEGWDATGPNVPTEVGLFPHLSQIETALSNIFHEDLFSSTDTPPLNLASSLEPETSNLLTLRDGFNTILHDFGFNTSGFSSSDLSSSFNISNLNEPIDDLNNHISSVVHGVNDVVNQFTTMLTQAYSLVLPTVDEVTSVLINLPVYDFSVFADNITTHPLDAVGLPAVSDVAISLLALAFEGMTIQETFQDIHEELTDLL